MAATKMQILRLYKSLLRESQKFSSFNFRMFALRKVRDTFRENRNITDASLIEKQLEYGKTNLNIIRRQALVEGMYNTQKLVIENSK